MMQVLADFSKCSASRRREVPIALESSQSVSTVSFFLVPNHSLSVFATAESA
jgi:hypothetical protein